MHLPDGHGLGVLRHLRAAGHSCDVIAVTSARDLDVVKHAVAQGVVAYLIKPFTFAGFAASSTTTRPTAARWPLAPRVDQGDVDAMLAALRPTARGEELPKGLSPSTLALVSADPPGDHRAGLTASDVANRIGASRVTARRYLEHLADSGLATRAAATAEPAARGGVRLVRSCRVRADGSAGVAGHQSPSSASASSPSGLTPGPLASEWPTRTCRHLTRVGIPPAVMPSISGTWPMASRSAR